MKNILSYDEFLIESTSTDIPKILISKKDYDKFNSTGKFTISRLSTKFSHSVNPSKYKQYPKNLESINIINPYTKEIELVTVVEIEHEREGVYITITK